MNWYLAVLQNYADFGGRARRREYWYYFLFNMLIAMALGFIEGMLGLYRNSGLSVFAGLYSLVVLIPSLAVGARRLHDTGRSGWWQLIALIPILGGLVLLVFLVQDSQPGDNAYGPNPKSAPAA